MVKKWKNQRDKRDGLTHFALPHVVIDSPGYRAASHTARSLLIDIARQYTGHNNGKLTACRKYLAPLGWKSNDVIVRARRELIDCRLLLETRKGARPNRAAWYAMTCYALDQSEGLDIEPNLYERSHRRGYLHPDPPTKPIDVLGPSDGADRQPIAPPRGSKPGTAAPSHGAMRGLNGATLHRAADRI